MPTFLLRNAPAWVTPLPSLQMRIFSYRSLDTNVEKALSFGTMLSPDYLWRRISRLVSCYAFFKGWLLLSQPPNCHRNSTTFLALSLDLGTLNRDHGLFPFWRVELSPHRLTAILNYWYSEFDRFSGLSTCLDLPVLYPQQEHMTRTQKLFRRKPAITEFD